jgi:hypothetical protein
MACECPTKLYYTGKSAYGNKKLDDPFLDALAQGGFQVGELAKLYYPGGVAVDTLDYDAACSQTTELLKQPEVVIYEAALRYKDLFVRVDILKKSKNCIDLIEVKAKSYDKHGGKECFYNQISAKKGQAVLKSDWRPYLEDVAFQVYVAQNALPGTHISAALMLADKSAQASVDGLNQMFIIEKDKDGRKRCKVRTGTKTSSVGDPVLLKLNVDAEVELIHNELYESLTFAQHVDRLSAIYKSDQRQKPVLSGTCKSCEYRISGDMKSSGLKSGFDECWQAVSGLDRQALTEPLVVDIWNYRGTEDLMIEQIYRMMDVEEEHISPKPSKNPPALSQTERQWEQVRMVKESIKSPLVVIEGLRDAFLGHKYPLHFIDFETMTAALPFNAGRRPYEQIAFQFSHHVMHEDGRIEHKDQYINTNPGVFPNFDFVRALKKALSTDAGTVFRYSHHENTVLCQIYDQIKAAGDEVPDGDELCDFIKTVTRKKSSEDNQILWQGDRYMVDLWELVKQFYLHPLTNGSNSIKYVLPAVINESKALQSKYSAQIYGNPKGIVSLNYKDWRWLQQAKDGMYLDPYKLLPEVFSDYDRESLDLILDDDAAIANGGAAMTAYARMQFTEMGADERARITDALLKYCELDTMAMVMIYEHWLELVNQKLEAA